MTYTIKLTGDTGQQRFLSLHKNNSTVFSFSGTICTVSELYRYSRISSDTLDESCDGIFDYDNNSDDLLNCSFKRTGELSVNVTFNDNVEFYRLVSTPISDYTIDDIKSFCNIIHNRVTIVNDAFDAKYPSVNIEYTL